MQAGKLNEIIELYKPDLSVNEYGEQVQIYNRCYTTRAQVTYQNGNRSLENNEIFFNYSVQFKVRHYVQINETYQIKYKDKKYRILSIEDNTQHNEKIIETELIND